MIDVAKLVVNLMGNATSYIQTLTTAQATLQTFASTTQRVVGKVTAVVGTAVSAVASMSKSGFGTVVPFLQSALPAALSLGYSAFQKLTGMVPQLGTAFQGMAKYAANAGVAFAGFVGTLPGKFLDTIEDKVTRVGNAFQALGKYVAIPAASLAGLSVKAFSDFDLAMTEATSIMVGLPNDQKVAMADLAKELSMKGKQSAEELAKAYYHLASAGLNARDAMGALPIIQNFATAGAFDLAKATDLAMTAQGALALRSEDAAQNVANLARITNVLVRANTLATGSAEQFSIALTTGAAVAGRGFGQDVEEIVGSLIVLHKQGIKAQEAGNMLARMWRILSQTAVMHAPAYKKLGVAVFDTKGQMRHASDIVEDLTKAFSKMSPELQTATMKSLGWEAKLQGAMKPFLGMSKVMKDSVVELRKASGGQGESARVAEKQMEAFTNQMKMTWNMTKVLAIEIGEMLAPALLALVLPLKEAIKWFRQLSKPAQEFILVAVGMTVALVTFFAVAVTGFMIMNTLTGGMPILMGLLIIGIVGASIAMAEFVFQMGGIGNTLAYLKQKGEEAWAWLGPVRVALKDFFMVLWFVARGTFDNLAALGLRTWDRITNGARVNWSTVRETIVASIVGAEWVLLHFQQAAEVMWAGVKYTAVRALNFIVEHIHYILAGPVVLAAFEVYLVNWNKLWQAAAYTLQKFGKVYGRLFNAQTLFFLGQNPMEQLNALAKELTTFELPAVKFTSKGFEVPELKDLEKKLKDEFEKLGAAAAKSFTDFYNQKLLEFGKTGFDDFYKKTLKDLYAKVGEGAEKAGMMMLGLNPQEGEKQGEDLGNAFNAGVNKTMGKFDAAIYRSAEAFSRIEAYRAQMEDDFNMSGPRHGGGRGGQGGTGHPHQKAVDVFAGQGGGGVGNVVARAEDTVPILKDIRAILAGADKKPGIKVDAADLA